MTCLEEAKDAEKNVETEVKSTFAGIVLILAWASLAAGVGGFLTLGNMRGGEAFAMVTLASGIFSFGVLGVLSEISNHLVEIRKNIISLKANNDSPSIGSLN